MKVVTSLVPQVNEIQKAQDKLYELKQIFIWILLYLKPFENAEIERKRTLIPFLNSLKLEAEVCLEEIKNRLSFRTEIKFMIRETKSIGNQVDNMAAAQRLHEVSLKHIQQVNPKQSFIDLRKEKFKEILRNVNINSNFIVRSKALVSLNSSKTLKIKCFSVLWNTFFLTHIYVISDKSTKKYKIIDIVCTNSQDTGEEEQDCMIEAKTIIENIKGDQSANMDETQRNLQTFLFNLNRGRLVFMPSTVLYKRFTNWIRYMYFKKRMEINLENLINNFIKPYKEILIPEEEANNNLGKRKRRCYVCNEKMKFISLKEGFVPPTIYVHSTNRYYHEKCYFFEN